MKKCLFTIFLVIFIVISGCSSQPNIKSNEESQPVGNSQTSSTEQSKDDYTGEDEQEIITILSEKYREVWEVTGAQIVCIIEKDLTLVDIEVETPEDAQDWDIIDETAKENLLKTIICDIYNTNNAQDISFTVSYEKSILSSAYYIKEYDRFKIYPSGDDEL